MYVCVCVCVSRFSHFIMTWSYWNRGPLYLSVGFSGGSEGKESACNAGDTGDGGFDPWAGKFPWRRKWPHTPVFLPRESHGQKSMEGYSPLGCKVLDVTERLRTHTYVSQRVGHDWVTKCTHTHTYVDYRQILLLSLISFSVKRLE